MIRARPAPSQRPHRSSSWPCARYTCFFPPSPRKRSTGQARRHGILRRPPMRPLRGSAGRGSAPWAISRGGRSSRRGARPRSSSGIAARCCACCGASRARAQLEHEARAMVAARAGGVRCPEPRGVIEVEGRPGLVLERIDGTDGRDGLATRLGRLWGTSGELGDQHARLGMVEAPLELPSVRDSLRDRIERAEVPEAVRLRALEYLDGLPDGDRICHGNFHPGNLISASDGPVVIDWAGATRGDPVADHARTLLMFRTAQTAPSTPLVLRALVESSAWRAHPRLPTRLQLAAADRSLGVGTLGAADRGRARDGGHRRGSRGAGPPHRAGDAALVLGRSMAATASIRRRMLALQLHVDSPLVPAASRGASERRDALGTAVCSLIPQRSHCRFSPSRKTLTRSGYRTGR